MYRNRGCSSFALMKVNSCDVNHC